MDHIFFALTLAISIRVEKSLVFFVTPSDIALFAARMRS
nr:MAG TPA: hypothetical protein [Caudoviricetes sp.]DAO10115.1 MAG TPA: hypothetical protein [Caudoviricetes sp.]DAU00900.1 MAG TPA: hypothetical protein [Caudoviricetes sp.]DAX38565.1 MAG TPA: hypothetical protein [Caudoviricetes sp.]